jgi:hypothetical protein
MASPVHAVVRPPVVNCKSQSNFTDPYREMHRTLLGFHDVGANSLSQNRLTDRKQVPFAVIKPCAAFAYTS